MIWIKRDYAKEPLRLLIDMDMTLYDLNHPWLDEYNRVYNNDVTIDQFEETWDFGELVRSGKCKKKDIFSILNQEGFYYNNVKPYEDAVEVIRRLNNNPLVEIYIVSSSQDGYQMMEKGDVIKRDFPFLSTDKLILCRDKWIIKGDIMFDDKPHTIEMCNKEKMITVARRVRYNESSNPTFYVNSCTEFENLVNQIISTNSLDKE